MSTPPLLANENWPRPALLVLRAAGLDVQAVGERMPRASDAEVLHHAASEGRWVLTFDRDYGELVFARAVAPPAGAADHRMPLDAREPNTHADG